MATKIAFAAGYADNKTTSPAFEIHVIMTDGNTPTPQSVKNALGAIIKQINAGAYADDYVNATKPTAAELKDVYNPRGPKLTPEQRDEIGRRAKNGASYAALAQEFHVSAAAIAYTARARGAKKRNQRLTT